MQTHKDIWFSNGGDISEWMYFNTRHQPYPVMQFIPYPIAVSGIVFPDGSEQWTAGGGGGGSGVSLLAGPGISLTPGLGTMTITNTLPAIPAGNPGQIQFNSGGTAFGGSPNLRWDGNNLLVGPSTVVNSPAPGPDQRVLSVQGSTGPGTVELSTGAGDANNRLIGNFMWIDKNNTSPSNDAGAIRVLTDGVTPNNRGTRMEFWIRSDNSPGPGPVMVLDNTNGHTLTVEGNINIDDPGGVNNYAFRINGVPITAGSQWTDITGGGIYYSGGYVGIGENNPQQMLHITNQNGYGYIRLESFSSSLPSLYSGLEFFTGGNYVAEIGAWFHNDPGDGLSIDVGTFIDNIYVNFLTGRVGILNGNPLFQLDVVGDVNCTGQFRINGVPITAAKADTDPTPPSNPEEGHFWFDSGNLRLFVRHSNAWFQVSA